MNIQKKILVFLLSVCSLFILNNVSEATKKSNEVGTDDFESLNEWNFIENGDFTQHDGCWPSYWGMNQKYFRDANLMNYDIWCGESPYRGKSRENSYSEFYWEYDEQSGIFVEDKKESMMNLSVMQKVPFINFKNIQKLDLTRPIYMGGILKYQDVDNISRMIHPLSFLSRNKKQYKNNNAVPYLTLYDIKGDNYQFNHDVNIFLYDVHEDTNNMSVDYYDEETGEFFKKLELNEDQIDMFPNGVFGYNILTQNIPIFLDQLYLVQETLRVETTPLVIPLGTVITQDLIKQHIENIEFWDLYDYTDVNDYEITSINRESNIFGKSLDEDIEFDEEELTADNVIQGEVYVDIKSEQNGEEITGIAKIPTLVTWGDSIIFDQAQDEDFENDDDQEFCDYDDLEDFEDENCRDHYNNDQKYNSLFGISLINNDSQYKVMGSFGHLENKDSLETYFNNDNDDKYIQIDHFSPEKKNNFWEHFVVNSNLEDKGDHSFTINGDNTAEVVMEEWVDFDVNVGDVIRVWTANPGRTFLFQDSQMIQKMNQLPNGQLVFYKVTEEGFDILYNNQVTIKEHITLPLNSDEYEIDDIFEDAPDFMLNIPDDSIYKDIKYEYNYLEEYPDTSELSEDVEGIVNYKGILDTYDEYLEIEFSLITSFIIDGEKLILSLESDRVEVSKKFKTNSEEEQKKEILTLAQPSVKQGEEIIADYKQIDLFDVDIHFTNLGKTEGTAEICYAEQPKICEKVSFKENTKPDPILWITDYDKWKNPSTNVVPKENSFMMMYSNEVKVVDHSSNIIINNSKDKAFYSITQENPWIQLSNVGYYKGQSVGLKIILKPSNVQNSSEFNYINIGSFQFLTISMNNNKDAQLDITYEFLDESGKPLKISGLWSLATLTNNKIVTMNTNQIKNIYSISRDGVENTNMKCTTCSLVSYQLVHNNNQEFIEFIGKGHDNLTPVQPPGAQPNQFQLAFTFDQQSSLNLIMINKSNSNTFPNVAITYGTTFNFLKVGIPDPESQNQKTEKITTQNKGKLSNEFIQYIPYLGQDHHPKKLEWIVKNKKEYDIFNSGTWKITDEKGNDRTHLFNIDVNTGIISVKNVDDDNLYNHYYHFNYTLPFNDQAEVDEKELNKDNYLLFEQDVIFNINQQKSATITSQNLINFNADVTYQYVDVSGINIKDSEVIQGILTKNYPTNKPKDISKYVFKESDPKNLSQEKIQYTDSTVKFIYEEGLSWLSNYSKWLDAEKSTIPKENAFMMMYSDDTEVVAWSDGIDKVNQGDIKQAEQVIYPTDQGPQWVKWKNVGYYQGKSVGVKLIISNFGKIIKKESEYNKIVLKGEDAFSIYLDTEVENISINYEFFESESEEPIKIDGYWNFKNIEDDILITMDTDQIEYIYSISRDGAQDNDLSCTTCTLLTYDISQQQNKERISISSQANNDDDYDLNQVQTTFTYKEKDHIAFDVSVKDSFLDTYIMYNSDGMVKVALPDPEPLNQKIDQITPKNRDKLTNEFVQYIPFEPENKRDQKMSWELPKNKTIDIFSPGSWEIINEKGTDSTSLFNIIEDDNTFKISPKDIENSDLYNHYYKFQYKLLFDENKQVKDTELTQEKHLIYEQHVNFKVDQEKLIQMISKTDINMNAKVTYEYLDSGSGKPIEDSIQESQLITHKILDHSKEIKDYTFIRSEPHNYQDTRILYSDQSVKLYYVEQLSTIVVPESLKFEEVNSLKKSSMIEKTWPIEVYNSKSNNWYVQVNQKTPLILEDKNYDICGLNEAPCFEYKTKEKLEYLSVEKPIILNNNQFFKNNNEYTLDWGNQSDTTLLFNGFKAYQYALNGIYTSSLEFQLINAY